MLTTVNVYSQDDAESAPHDSIVKEALPTPFDKRVTTFLEMPVPDSIVVSVAMIAKGKDPEYNYRWILTADGKLFYVHRSKNTNDWQVPFDRPLPVKPTRIMTDAGLKDIQTMLNKANFFSHPGYEYEVGGEDGEYLVVCARKDGRLHTVVYENSSISLVDYLESLIQ